MKKKKEEKEIKKKFLEGMLNANKKTGSKVVKVKIK